MQVCRSFSPQLQIFTSPMHKTSSVPNLKDQVFYSSSSSIESIEEGYWRCATKWILRLRKKLNVSKSTLYLAISYLWRMVKLGCNLNESNYQKIAATLVLMSAKMNQIYPPKMSILIQKATKPLTKQDMIVIEGWILDVFNFDMTFGQISYSVLTKVLGEENKDKMEDSQKLLGLAVTQKDIMKAGEEMVALAVAYLIKPALVREWNNDNNQKLKAVATKVYNLYVLNKAVKNS